MRASFTDPQGPKRWRALPYFGALLTFVLACSLLDGNAAWVVALTSLAAFNLLGVVPLRQRKARVVELSTKPGVVEIRRAGTRTQKIRARDIVGATTARTREGVLLTFQHGKREQPISLGKPRGSAARPRCSRRSGSRRRAQRPAPRARVPTKRRRVRRSGARRRTGR